jgi:hypothetical protein
VKSQRGELSRDVPFRRPSLDVAPVEIRQRDETEQVLSVRRPVGEDAPQALDCVRVEVDGDVDVRGEARLQPRIDAVRADPCVLHLGASEQLRDSHERRSTHGR